VLYCTCRFHGCAGTIWKVPGVHLWGAYSVVAIAITVIVLGHGSFQSWILYTERCILHCSTADNTSVRDADFFSDRIVNIWNTLPNDIVSSCSVAVFKRKLHPLCFSSVWLLCIVSTCIYFHVVYLVCVFCVASFRLWLCLGLLLVQVVLPWSPVWH